VKISLGIAFVLGALAAVPARAQLYKCVDDKGKTHYSDKQQPGCKREKEIAPKAATRQPTAQPQVAPRSSPPLSREDECRQLTAEYNRLNRGASAKEREARIAQMHKLGCS
jgi:hypothetical protein